MKNIPKKKDGDNGGLIALLIGLGVVVVALGIVIWLIVGGKAQGPGGSGVITRECEEKNALYDINACIEEKYNDTGDVGVIINGYRDAIDTAKEAKDYWLAAKLVTSRTSLLAVNGYCDKAMSLARSESMEEFDTKELGYIYSYVVGSSTDCEDEEAYTYWSELMNKQGEIEGGLGF